MCCACVMTSQEILEAYVPSTTCDHVLELHWAVSALTPQGGEDRVSITPSVDVFKAISQCIFKG